MVMAALLTLFISTKAQTVPPYMSSVILTSLGDNLAEEMKEMHAFLTSATVKSAGGGPYCGTTKWKKKSWIEMTSSDCDDIP
ncbi:hypothetical protein BC829DRAFT_386594 [Chytridium lagenaria]|nr:hypothetical protein BC829DRAFT_386594 [Chytridium lagenaria]